MMTAASQQGSRDSVTVRQQGSVPQQEAVARVTIAPSASAVRQRHRTAWTDDRGAQTETRGDGGGPMVQLLLLLRVATVARMVQQVRLLLLLLRVTVGLRRQVAAQDGGTANESAVQADMDSTDS